MIKFYSNKAQCGINIELKATRYTDHVDIHFAWRKTREDFGPAFSLCNFRLKTFEVVMRHTNGGYFHRVVSW